VKKQPRPTEQLTKVFGLIAKTTLTSTLVLSHSMLSLADVMPSIVAGLSEQELFKAHPGLRPEEIKAAKAYLARFGSDLENPRPLPCGPKSLLLDENVPYTLIPLVTQHFGVSSHVEAEGLSRQNLAAHNKVPRKALDSRIARFAADNHFAGIVTGDTDFAALYKFPGHAVRNLNVFLIDANDRSLSVEKRLIRHQHAIRQQLNAATPDLIRI
jgi:hypothetical protein